jgi:putative adhesin
MRAALFVRIPFEVSLVIALACAVPATAAIEGSFQRSLSVSGPVDIDINTGSGSITVHSGASDRVEVRGRIRASDWSGNGQEKVRRLEAAPPIQQSGNSIHIGHIEDPELRRNVSISYELTVPAETELKAHSGSGNQTVDGIRGPLEINAGSGGVRISNIGDTVRADTGSGNIDIDRVKGNVRAHAGSGSIRATEVAGGFQANTGSGRITLNQISPGAVRAETGSGGMELRGVRGSLEARAGSGDIRAEGDPTGGWIVHTGSGGVHLRLPNDASFDLNARTSSGSISLEHPVTVQGTLGRKEIRGKVRGGGVLIEVQTGSGNIEIL